MCEVDGREERDMSDLEILDIMYITFQMAVRLTMPFLLVSMVVGVIIAIFQAATQINEQTLTFVPKFLSILAVMGFLGSSILVMLQDFLRQMVGLMAGG
jgi:Flagellar biosynthesis pathway, component FliQ